MLDLKKKVSKKRWKESEKNFLKENAGKMTDAELAKRLNKSVKAIREARYRLGLKKCSGRGIVELVDNKSKPKPKD
jgi:hypothetical protein